jgi:O-succinylbenzoate synthase
MPIDLRRLTLREIQLPLREPFHISSGFVADRRILLLELTDADGFTAWSECVAGEIPNYSPETIDTAWLAIQLWVAPRVFSTSFTHPSEVHQTLEHNFRGHRMAKAAVEMAIWALHAYRTGESLSKTLGGNRDKVATGISLGIQQSPDELTEKARKACREGYRKIKLKITPGSDIEFVRAVRQEVGDSIALMADANNAYTMGDLETLLELDTYNLIMIEQPLAWDDLVRHAELQRRMATPLCLDESITSVDRVHDMLTLKSGRIVNIKPGRVGGLTASRSIHDLCQQHGIPVWCGGMLESGIGRSYNVALASLPNFTLPGDISPSARYWEKDIVTPEWTMDRTGFVAVPTGKPGLGVDVDVGRIENLTTRSETLLA